ncbi:DUF1579 domain-containing protein [Aeromicrobium ginsengisoli]|uniref:DUF1579 domain-containing protein n=1 Tax=Aeromicrobium ginsengisoli TaxID=363867 RepID=A0A5M4FC83_9ACTN|nr:DUF1579 domain-containing protein [Aeromicrobium ginsengisoli]KAA1396014.1 DUF1579 domain-containing protein [Aeromicrobium ginsengisoli]
MTISNDMSFLVGTASGTETVAASAWSPAKQGRSTVTAAAEADGVVLVQRVDDEFDDGSHFAGLNVFTLDPETAEILCYGFDMYGFPPDPPARGSWQDGELVLERTTPRGSARIVFGPTATGYTWRKDFRPDVEHEWQPVAAADLQRT